MHYNTKHSCEPQEGAAPARAQRLASILNLGNEVLIPTTVELQHVIPLHLIVREIAALELREEFWATNVDMMPSV